MNDDQFEREVREAARRIADHSAPSTLHSQVAAIPAEHPHRARRGRRFGGRLRLAGAATVILAVVAATTFFVGALARFNAVLPGGSPSESPTSGSTPTPYLARSATPTSRFSPTDSMTTGRFDGSATLLPDGRVLIAGGQDTSGGESASAELYDPTTGTFSQTGPMVYPRISPTATLLPDGMVLIAGGSGIGDVLERGFSAELYDPKTGTFSLTGPMNTRRYDQAATLLPDGRVLLVGGSIYNLGSKAIATAELYDPKTDKFTMTGSMRTARDGLTVTLLPSGHVLVAGGYGSSGNVLASAELYDPVTGKFTLTGTMTTARSGDTATLLPDGRVLMVGGYGSSGKIIASAELYDPKTGTFSSTGSMAIVRGGHTATLLPDGRVLIAGGTDSADDNLAANILASAELYDPLTGAFGPAGSMATARQLQTATLLRDGRVLIAGGADGTTPPSRLAGRAVALPSAELYQP
jgi:WD40 repeat protein